MALFSSSSSDSVPMAKSRSAPPSNPVTQVNIIGRGTTIEGTLRSQSDVSISGRVEGNLNVEGKVIVTAEGEVEGQVEATSADVGGRVQGELTVKERLVLKNSAVVEGNIRAGKLVIEDGARFNGQCDMSEAVRASGRPSPPNRRGGPSEPATPEAA